MTLEEKRFLALERLDATIEQIKTLHPNQFNYHCFIKEGKDGCGTVCCIAGWYPKWFPESELTWVKSPHDLHEILLASPETKLHIDTFQRNNLIIQRLSKYHNLAEFTIRSLFFGESLNPPNSDDYILCSASFGIGDKITDILKRFETVRALIMIGNHDNLLNKL